MNSFGAIQSQLGALCGSIILWDPMNYNVSTMAEVLAKIPKTMNVDKQTARQQYLWSWLETDVSKMSHIKSSSMADVVLVCGPVGWHVYEMLHQNKIPSHLTFIFLTCIILTLISRIKATIEKKTRENFQNFQNKSNQPSKGKFIVFVCVCDHVGNVNLTSGGTEQGPGADGTGQTLDWGNLANWRKISTHFKIFDIISMALLRINFEKQYKVVTWRPREENQISIWQYISFLEGSLALAE